MNTQGHSHTKQTVGANIAHLRGTESRREFGARIGVDQMLVYKWERGKNTPNPMNMERIASVCGVDVAWLYTDHGRRAA